MSKKARITPEIAQQATGGLAGMIRSTQPEPKVSDQLAGDSGSPGKRPPNTRLTRGGEAVKRHTWYVRPDQARRLKIIAATDDRDVSELVREAIDLWLEKHDQNAR